MAKYYCFRGDGGDPILKISLGGATPPPSDPPLPTMNTDLVLRGFLVLGGRNEGGSSA